MKAHSMNIIGIDLGGTRTKIGLIDPQGKILNFKSVLTRVDRGKDQALKRIIRILSQFIKISSDNNFPPQLVGLGAPGFIDREAGIVRHSPNFPDWREVPLAQIISQGVGLPSFVDNDANAVTWGEKWVGAGRDLSNFICLTLGTGVGSGLILNDRLWYGSQGSGPEFGHVTMRPRGERCGCGNRGCLETEVSATYLMKKAQRGLEKNIPTQLREILSRGSKPLPLSTRLLFQGAIKGDPFCISLFAEMGKYLGIALANIVHTLGLEGVILGGGVSRAATIFLPYLEKEFKKRLTMVPAEKVSIRVSSLGEKSGILGAAKMAWERTLDPR